MPDPELYHRYKRELIKEIQGTGGKEREPVFCMFGSCEKEGYEEHEWHFHHVISENGHNGVGGGVQHYYRVKEDYESGEPILVVCRKHHLEIHDQESLFEDDIDG